jgi:hypothetical protein
MANENKNGLSVTSGASGFNPQSVPQLTPVFSFHSEGGGDIYVYLAQTEVTKFAVLSFDDTSSEYIYAVETITSSSKVEAEELVFKASREWSGEEDNPFLELLRDKEAMERLHALLSQFFESEGDE